MTTSRRHLTGWVFLSPELHFIGHRIFRLRNSLHLLSLQWHQYWGRLISWVPICQTSGIMLLYVVIVCKCTSEYLRAPGFQDLQIPGFKVLRVPGFESPPGSWVRESSGFLGSQVLQVPGFSSPPGSWVLESSRFLGSISVICYLLSIICYLLSVICYCYFSVQCHCHRLTKKLTLVKIFQKVCLHVAPARSEVFVGNPSGHLSSFASRTSRSSNRHPVLVVSEEACHRLYWNRREQK